MKKILVAVATLAVLVACKNEEHTDANVHITGNVKGFKKGRIFIKELKDTSLVNIDTIEVDGDSNFASHLKMSEPDMLYMVIDRGTTESIDDNLRFFADPGDVTIETTLDYFYSRAKIKAGRNQEKLTEYEKLKKRFTDTRLELIERNIMASKSGNKTRLDSIAKASDDNTRRSYLFTANFALNNGDYEVSPYIVLSEIPDINSKYLDTIVKRMTPRVAKSKYGKMLVQHLKENKQAENTANIQ
ncbi:DUF4369 domain-containing protein [Flavobacterium sp. RNTU_13]|uniref:DUF4369 domain-containing protein n=1 Tax=Flavobacterium sp. RNTU_13 TaxID=3375145 RepID=UPI0039859C30